MLTVDVLGLLDRAKENVNDPPLMRHLCEKISRKLHEPGLAKDQTRLLALIDRFESMAEGASYREGSFLALYDALRLQLASAPKLPTAYDYDKPTAC
jgi:hypothetical protein